MLFDLGVLIIIGIYVAFEFVYQPCPSQMCKGHNTRGEQRDREQMILLFEAHG